MFYILSHKGNANQNNTETCFTSVRTALIRKQTTAKTDEDRTWGKRNADTLLMGM
jgi:hypothetical protein